MKKINLFLCALVLMLSMFVVGNSTVFASTSAPATLKMGSATRLQKYLNVSSFYYKKLSNGKIVYCVEYNDVVPGSGSQLTRSSAYDAGMVYILENGYPTKKMTSDNNKNYYITQVAIWYYLGDISTSKINSLGNSTMVKYIKQLKNGADAAKKAGFKKPSISVNADSSSLTLSNDGKYYVSKPVSVNATLVSGKYNISLVDAPKGAIITNTSGTKVSQLATNQKFIIKVPVASVTNTSYSFNVKITATGEVKKAYRYNAPKSSQQNMVPAVLYGVTNTLATSKKFTLKAQTYNIKVIKRDSATSKALAGATMVLKNSAGKTVDTWVSTTGTHTTSGLLAGTYTLTESKAPEGYKLNSTVEKIILSGTTTTVTKEFFNTPKPVTYSLNISKKDSVTKKNIAGATMVLKNSAGSVVKTWTTTTDNYSITGLSAGTYTLSETKAPEGYELSNEVKTITLSGASTIKSIEFYNTKKETKGIAKISKQDLTTKTELPGATLVIKNSNGETVDTWTSTEEVHYVTLEAGTYTLTETQAPNGYVLSTETISFEVKADGTVTSVVMYNEEVVPEPVPEEPTPEEPTPEEEVVAVPITGVNSTAKYLFSGLSTLLGLGLIYKNKFSK